MAPIRHSSHSEPGHGVGNNAAPRILVVDDHAIGQELIGLMAGKLGVAADLACDGHEAIQMVEAAAAAGQPYALVLMDFFMPIVDGLEATRRLRAYGHDAESLPIIALTACAEPQQIAGFRAMGGQAHITKPVSLADLSAVFDAWIPASAGEAAAEDRSAMTSLARRYHQRKAETRALFLAACEVGRVDAALARQLADALHKLAGTAGFFAEQALSQAALAAEAALLHGPPHERRKTVVAFLDLLDATGTREEVAP